MNEVRRENLVPGSNSSHKLYRLNLTSFGYPLPVLFLKSPNVAIATVKFFVVDAPSAYNAILGRGRLNAIEALVSTSHFMMKFPTERGVGVEKGQQQVARDCYLVALKGKGGHVV